MKTAITGWMIILLTIFAASSFVVACWLYCLGG